MVSTNHSWEEESRKYISDIRTELNETQKRFEEDKAKLDTLQRELEAWESALQSHLKRTGRPETLKSNLQAILEKQKNHKDRIKIIAEQNNGQIKVGYAADILYNYGILKSKSRMAAYRIVYGLVFSMAEAGIFEKIGAGEFRLIGAQSKLMDISVPSKNIS
jgi:hypothetical protein